MKFLPSFFLLFRAFLLSIALIFVKLPAAKADDVIDTTVDVLSHLTCETGGAAAFLLRSQFSHTCLPAPFFDMAVANILSPGMYVLELVRLKINDDELFPGSCLRKNRLDPVDTKMDFAFCNDLKLALQNAKAMAESTGAIFSAAVTGNNPWDGIKDAWDIPEEDYHDVYKGVGEGYTGVLKDILLPWEVIKINDRLCVATYNIFGQLMPIGCRYIKEPYPDSIYAGFMDDSASVPDQAKEAFLLTSCSSFGGCYQRAVASSLSPLPITGPVITCISESLVRMLVSPEVCSFKDANLIAKDAKLESSAFYQMRQKMRTYVGALLILYTIFFGLRIILSPQAANQKEIINFFLKIIFVAYFSVGLNFNGSGGSPYGDGMTDLVLPFLVGGMQQLASIVSNASTDGLCTFSSSDYQGVPVDMSLWDSLDCRLIHYLGIDQINHMLNSYVSGNFVPGGDFFSFSVPPYFILLIPAVISGNLALVNLVMVFPLLVISVVAYVVSLTAGCMVMIVILTILAPIFVPTILFKYTSQYFQGWAKTLLSFMLQPLVACVFVIVTFTIYDQAFYGTCKYFAKDISLGDRDVRAFFVQSDWSLYDSDDDVKNCKISLGYMINHPFSAAYDLSSSTLIGIGQGLPDLASYFTSFDILKGVTSNSGNFFSFFTVAFETLLDFIFNLIIGCLCLYLMYKLSEELAGFVADMTEGISMGGMVDGIQDNYSRAMDKVDTVLSSIPKGTASKKEVYEKGAEDFASGKDRPNQANRLIENKAPAAGESKIVETKEALENLEGFLKEQNIDPDKLEGSTTGTLSRNLSFLSKDKFSDKFKEPYENGFRNLLQKNEKLKGKEVELAENIESMYKGEKKETVKNIHDKVFRELGIVRGEAGDKK